MTSARLSAPLASSISFSIDAIESYLPTLLGKAQEQKTHPYLYWEFYAQGGKRSVRLGDWKGVQLKVHADRNGPVELYNLKDDLGETKNIAADHPEIVAKIRKIMREASKPSEIFRWRGSKKR